MCQHEIEYYINRSNTCVSHVLQHLLFAQNIKEEDEMAALFDYMSTNVVQWYLNLNENTLCCEIRTKILNQIDFYKTNPPANNKFASDLAELEEMLKVEPGIIDPYLKTMSNKSSQILYPYTSQKPTNETYRDYAYNSDGDACENSVQELTCYYHLMIAANNWSKKLDE